MKNIIKEYKIITVFFILVTFILFWQFFLKGLYPFPGDFQLAWFEPWKTDHFTNSTIQLPHKPIGDDIFRQIYPFRTLAIDMMKNLQPPLWNPYNGAGMPLLATLNIGFLDPFNFLFFILPYAFAWSIYIVLQFYLIGLFTYIYCRKIQLNEFASLFAGLVFSLSGFIVVRLIFVMYGISIAMIPLALYLIEDYRQDSKNKTFLLLPLIVYIIVVSTQPQVALYILFFIFFYVVFFTRHKPISLNLRRIFTILLLMILGVGLSAIQLMPTFELYKYSNINQASSTFIFEKFLLPLNHLLTIFIPNYFGNPSTYNFWGKADYIETITYIGLIPLLFVFMSLKTNTHRKKVIFFMLVVFLSIFISLNHFFTKLIYSIDIPIISTGIPTRIFLLTTFSLSIMSGIGFNHWLMNKDKAKNIIKILFIFSSIVFVIAAYTTILFITNSTCPPGPIQNCRLISMRNLSLELIFFIPSIILILAKLLNYKFTKFVPIFIIILFTILGIYNALKFLPFSKKANIMPLHPVIKTIKEDAKYERVLGFDNANIPTNFATHYRFFDPQYYHPLYLKRYGELIYYANRTNIFSMPRSDVEIANDINLDANKNETRSRLLDILAVKYFIYKKSKDIDSKNIVWQDKNWQIIENKNALPRVYLVNNLEIVKDKNKILKKLFSFSFNPKRDLILEEKPKITLSQNDNASDLFIQDLRTLCHSEPFDSAQGKLREESRYFGFQPQDDKDCVTPIIDKYSELEVTIKTNSNFNHMLVISDNFYPGWKAYVDDKETKIYRANYTFRAIELPAGNHIVKFSYEPNSFKIGLAMSIISTILYIIIAVCMKRLNKKNND